MSNMRSKGITAFGTRFSFDFKSVENKNESPVARATGNSKKKIWKLV